MGLTIYTAWVPGHAAPKGSLVSGVSPQGRPFTKESSKRTKPWVELIADDASFRWRRREPLAAPVSVMLSFHLPKPKSSALAFPTGRGSGDLDKLVRAILDGLQSGGVLADDANVTRIEAWKAWATEAKGPGVYIIAQTVEAEAVADA